MMTMAEVADILAVSEKTVSRMLQDGAIPGFKVANQWRFHREDFQSWIDEKRKGAVNSARVGLAAMLSDETAAVPLSRLTDEKLIVTGMSAAPREQILSALTEPLISSGLIQDGTGFLEGLNAREEMMSTAVGGGLAIPHLRNPGDTRIERPAIVIASCPIGLDWDAFDGEPVRLLVLPISGTDVEHLRILSAIRRVLAADGAIETLVQSTSPSDLFRSVLKLEALQGSLGK